MSKIENLIEKDNFYYKELLLCAEDEIKNLIATTKPCEEATEAQEGISKLIPLWLLVKTLDRKATDNMDLSCLCAMSTFVHVTNNTSHMNTSLLYRSSAHHFKDCCCISILHGQEPYHEKDILECICEMEPVCVVLLNWKKFAEVEGSESKAMFRMEVIFEKTAERYANYGRPSAILLDWAILTSQATDVLQLDWRSLTAHGKLIS